MIQERLPLYFVKTLFREIRHDSPCIGAWGYGRNYPDIFGPYVTKQEAADDIERLKEKMPKGIDGEFSSEMITKCFPKESFPPKFETYTEEVWGIEIEQRYMGSLNQRPGYLLPEAERWKLLEKIPIIAEKLDQLLLGIAHPSKTINRQGCGKGVLGLSNGLLFSTNYLESWSRNEAETKEFTMTILSKESDKLKSIILGALGEEQRYFSFDFWPERKYFIQAPAPQLTLNGNTLEEVIENNGFIY